jgi:D-3-phosphoglycerate dehydrogenase
VRDGNRGSEIKGKTVGIIGYGNTGSAFAERLRGFGAEVIAYDKFKTGFANEWVQEVQMDEIFRKTDILSLHVPLTADTKNLINSAYLSRFSKPVYLINTARGQCVNTTELVNELETGKVKGAALDVLDCEKLSFENLETDQLPEQYQKLFSSEKVILSPHIAGWTHESHYRLAKVLVDKIIKL